MTKIIRDTALIWLTPGKKDMRLYKECPLICRVNKNNIKKEAKHIRGNPLNALEFR
jgi:hypothetical protein